ncbi:MAG: signal peptidase I [Lachnospiraceae bacterium]|nr:signal peptidase I [Lachnospiraceae bacterium]
MEFEIEYQKGRRRRRRRSAAAKFFIWVLQIAAVIFLAWFVINVVLEKTSVLGDSMEETLSDGDSIIVNKFAYLFKKPERGDVIVFKQSGSEHDYYDLKRIVGLPGETIQIKEGAVYINGQEIKEKVNCERMLIPGLAKDPFTLEEGEYFVLGDNRNNSEDSRFANVGTIVEGEIVGKAWLRLNEFGFIGTMNLRREEGEEK